MARLVALSLTVLLASTAVAYAQPGDGGGRRDHGDRGGEARGEWRERGDDGGGRPRAGRRDAGAQQQVTPRDTGQRPGGDAYVPRHTPQAPAAIANNGGPPTARHDGAPRDGQGWRDAGRSGPRRDFGDTGAGRREGDRVAGALDGGNGAPPVVAGNGAWRRDGNRGGQWSGDGRHRGDDNLEGGRDNDGVRRGGDGRAYGDGRNDRGSDRWTERGHDSAGYTRRDGDRHYSSGHRDHGRPGDGHGYRDRDNGRSWYNPQHYHHHYRAPYRYRAAPYFYPNGWFVRTWYYGDYLPGGWYSSRYYLDWRAYGLAYPPIGCEWIRVGHDALLVDVWTGEVLSVYYDLFW